MQQGIGGYLVLQGLGNFLTPRPYGIKSLIKASDHWGTISESWQRESREQSQLRTRSELRSLTLFSPGPFCNHGQSVTCEIDKKNMLGRVECFVCKEDFDTTIGPLTEAIDVYSEWIDECIKVNQSDWYFCIRKICSFCCFGSSYGKKKRIVRLC